MADFYPNVEVKEELCDVSDSGPHPENQGGFENLEVKIENADIDEQFIDGTGIHDREEYIAKEEYDHDSGISQKVGNEIFSSPKMAENYQQESGICDHSLVVEETTEQHMNLHVKREQHEFSTTNHINGQMRHVDLSLKKRKCHLCDFVANKKIELKNHIRSVHFNIKEHKCHICNYCSNLKYYLNNHIESVHLNLKQYRCTFCDYAGNQKKGLNNHMNSVHFNLKKHKCNLCDYAANQKKELKNHINSVHFNIKEHKCILCEYSTNRNVDLKRHIESVHLNLKPYKCNVCEYSANRKKILKKHIDSVHLH